jgi:hypothetical protein
VDTEHTTPYSPQLPKKMGLLLHPLSPSLLLSFHTHSLTPLRLPSSPGPAASAAQPGRQGVQCPGSRQALARPHHAACCSATATDAPPSPAHDTQSGAGGSENCTSFKLQQPLCYGVSLSSRSTAKLLLTSLTLMRPLSTWLQLSLRPDAFAEMEKRHRCWREELCRSTSNFACCKGQQCSTAYLLVAGGVLVALHV